MWQAIQTRLLTEILREELSLKSLAFVGFAWRQSFAMAMLVSFPCKDNTCLLLLLWRNWTVLFFELLLFLFSFSWWHCEQLFVNLLQPILTSIFRNAIFACLYLYKNSVEHFSQWSTCSCMLKDGHFTFPRFSQSAQTNFVFLVLTARYEHVNSSLFSVV